MRPGKFCFGQRSMFLFNAIYYQGLISAYENNRLVALETRVSRKNAVFLDSSTILLSVLF